MADRTMREASFLVLTALGGKSQHGCGMAVGVELCLVRSLAVVLAFDQHLAGFARLPLVPRRIARRKNSWFD